ncbi:hypothetical protein BC827DRAFT_1266414 [Russula dissimulans]|nr:hypothetical protein BC827DRAFT_1266414 [Russula dissimulans]
MSSLLPQIALETEFDNVPALTLYMSLGFILEKRLHHFYLNGKDAFCLVLPLTGAEDAAMAAASNDSHQQHLRPSALLSLLLHHPPGAVTSSTSSDDDDDDASFMSATMGEERAESVDEEDYVEDTARLVKVALPGRHAACMPHDHCHRLLGRLAWLAVKDKPSLQLTLVFPLRVKVILGLP